MSYIVTKGKMATPHRIKDITIFTFLNCQRQNKSSPFLSNNPFIKYSTLFTMSFQTLSNNGSLPE